MRIKLATFAAVSAARQGANALLNVTAAAGRSVTFSTAFSASGSVLGDYSLDLHCYALESETLQGETSYTLIKTPSGFTIYPDFDCELITWHTSPFNSPLPGTPAEGQHGVEVSPTGIAATATFGTPFVAVSDYNVAYVRAFLTSDPTIAVEMLPATKAISGLTLTPANITTGLSITIEWGVSPRTQ
jgi:hypothetical protein